MLRNVLPRPLPAGMSVATCPARARWDMLAKPGWAAASAGPCRTLVAGNGQRSLFLPARLGFLLPGPLLVGRACSLGLLMAVRTFSLRLGAAEPVKRC